MFSVIKTVSLIVALLFTSTVFANPEYTIVIKEHKFHPDSVEVPTGQKIKLIIDNQDPTPEEFESHTLYREKIVAGNSKITIYVGPLDVGEYEFFGEFNESTAQGKLIVR